MQRIVTFGSLVGGVLIGANLNEQHKKSIKHMISDLTSGHSRVHASTIARQDNSKSLEVTAPTPKGNLVEVMKHGLPTYENIRTFEDFVLSYDRRNRNANWVFEHLTKEKVAKNPAVSRDQSEFKEDVGIHKYYRSTNKDYKNSGYDRGHLAAAGNHRFSQKSTNDTFHLSNISPQVKSSPG